MAKTRLTTMVWPLCAITAVVAAGLLAAHSMFTMPGMGKIRVSLPSLSLLPAVSVHSTSNAVATRPRVEKAGMKMSGLMEMYDTDKITPSFNFTREYLSELNAAPLRPRKWGHPADERGFPFPFVSGDLFRQSADFDAEGHDAEWKGGSLPRCSVIFLKAERVEPFFQNRRPTITVPYILITHNSDVPNPGVHYAKRASADPLLSMWFTQNQDVVHAKVQPIPIGIGNMQWDQGKLPVWLAATLTKPKLWSERSIFLFIAWSDSTYKSHRSTVRKMLSKLSHDTKAVEGRISHDEYLSHMADSKFVVSPRGNGLDCHRTWEAILMGAIPIVETSSMSASGLYLDAPVLVVDNFLDITESYLRSWKPSPSYSRKVGWANHWLGKIQDAVAKCNRTS
jgi:hypothetical protein